MRWLLAALTLLLVLLALAVASAWVFRTSLAEAYVARYCDQRGLECEADIKRIGLNSADIASLNISANGQSALTTRSISAEYSWSAFLSPKIGPVTITDPVLRAGFDGALLDLRGLDRLTSSGGGGEPIDLTVHNGQVVLATPAGELTGTIDVSGALPRSGDARISIAPAELQSGSDRLSWTKGDAALTIENGRVTGTAEFQIDEALLSTLSVEAASFEATLAGPAEAPVIQWRGTARRLGLEERELLGVDTRGEAYFTELPDGGFGSVIQTLKEVAGEITAESVNFGGATSGGMTLTGDLKRGEGMITGPVAFTANAVSTLTGFAETASATGRLNLDPEDPGALTFTGSGILQGAGMNGPQRRSWLEGVGLPEPFGAHGQALNAALDQALSAFDSGADIKVSRAGERWELSASRPTALSAKSGMTISIEPAVASNWLSLTNDGLIVSGEIVASGGGGPTLRTLLTSGRVSPGQLSIDAADLELEPWTKDTRTLGVNLRPFRLESSDGRLRVSTRGDVAIAGSFPGAVLRDTKLSGGFEATRGAEGWRIQTSETACLDLITDGVTSGAISLLPVALNICPEDGRFVREENGIPTGRLSLGDVRLPFKMRDTSGELNLDESFVEWKLDSSLRTQITSTALSMPLNLGARHLTIEGERPSLLLETGEGPFRFTSSLGASRFAGDLIPAKVTSAGFSFTGSVPASGLIGRIRSADVRIEDYRDDPIYTPLRADLTATLENGRVSMTGPLRLQRSGWTIAQAEMELALADLTGTASLVGSDLRFEPAGLQPHDLSDLLRPILPNARGAMRANADFTITRGELAGTGNVSFDDLSFDTFRLGAINGVSGRINFSDILELTTLPDQIVSVGRIDPGVPLSNGRIAFQLVGGRVLELQGARWPFAGGELYVAPTQWELGGDTELVTITADKLELSELTEVLSLNEIKARGTVSGTFAVEIIGPDAFLRGAVLIADARGGQLAYTGKGLDSAKGYGEFTDHAVDALRALDYEVLELRADGNIAGEIVLGLKLLGRNPQVLAGQPFEFNINLTAELAQLIRNVRSSASSTVIIDQVKEQILQNAGVPKDSE